MLKPLIWWPMVGVTTIIDFAVILSDAKFVVEALSIVSRGEFCHR